MRNEDIFECGDSVSRQYRRGSPDVGLVCCLQKSSNIEKLKLIDLVSILSFNDLCALQRAKFHSYFFKGVQRLGQTQQSKVFGLPCNALQQSIIATIKFALGRQIQFESGPMQFLLKIDCGQQS